MKAMMPLNILLATSMVISTPGFAQQEAGTNPLQADISDLNLDKAMKPVKDKNSLISKLMKSVEKLCAPPNTANDKEDAEREINSSKFKALINKEIARYKIRFKISDLEDLIDIKFLKSGIGYQYEVGPAFRNNEQLRKDIWYFQLGLSNAAKFSVGVGTTVRVTFSRYYGGKSAKWKAATACPYFPDRMPMNTNDLKTKLREGDGVRFEVVGTVGGSTDEVIDGSVVGNVSAGLKTEALFLMDLFKLKLTDQKGQQIHRNQFVRTRMIGVKNKGEFSLGFTVKNDSPLDFIRGKLREIVTLGLFASIRKTLSVKFWDKKDYPLDTMMVDYLYKFSSPDELDLDKVKARTDLAESAMEELFSNIRNVGFSILFMPQNKNEDKNDERLGERLLEKVKITEDLAKEDLKRYREGKIGALDMRVRAMFKGRMQSNLFAGEGKIWFSKIYSKKSQVGNLDSYVTSYDENMTSSYYYLNSVFQNGQTKKLLGRERNNYSHAFDVLVLSDKNRTTGQISDIVMQNEFQNTDMSADEIQEIKGDLARTLPISVKSDPKFLNYFPTTDQTGAFLSHRYVFGHDAFKAIAKINVISLGQGLHDYLDNHPDRKHYMHLPVDNPLSPGGLGTYSVEVATDIMKIVNPNVTEDEMKKNPNIGNERSFEAFKRASSQINIFEKYLIGEFFPSILPTENIENLFSLQLKFSGDQSGELKPEVFGKKTVSPVYDAVSFLRSVISDPSLDMQMEASSDNTGNKDIVKPSKANSTINLPLRGAIPAVAPAP